MRLILAIIFILCAADAFAAEPSPQVAPSDSPKPRKFMKRTPVKDRIILAAGIAAVGELANDNRAFEPRALVMGRAGLVLSNRHEFLVELGGFKQRSGTSGVEITRFHQQIELWYHFLFSPHNTTGHPFIGAALGAQRDEVSTSFFGQVDKSTGAFETQASVAGGYRLNLTTNAAVWFEGRVSTSNNYQPRVLPLAAISIGFVL